MENKKFTITTKQIAVGISTLIAIMSGELAIGTHLFETDSDRIFVGFFIDEQSKKLKFIHTDGDTYRPILDKSTGRYFIILDDGDRIWCY